MALGSKKLQMAIASVEFLFVAPLLLFMMMAVAEGGRAFIQHNAVTKSVRDAARYVAGKALVGTTVNQVVISGQLAGEAKNLAVYGNITNTGPPMIPGLSTNDISVINAGGGNITVRAAYTYAPLLGAVLPNFGIGADHNMGFVLNSEITMRAL